MADAERWNPSQLVAGGTDADPATGAQQDVVSGDSAASTSSSGPAVLPQPHAVEASSASSPSPPSHVVASLPPLEHSSPSRTPSPSPSVTPSRGSAPPPALTESASELHPDAAATSRAQAGHPAPPARESSDHRAQELPPSAVSQARHHVRAPANSLPSPLRAPSGSDAQADGDGGSSTSSQQASPNLDTDHPRVAGGLGARGLDVGGTGADELELSVPSHQEHLTSDGQRYLPRWLWWSVFSFAALIEVDSPAIIRTRRIHIEYPCGPRSIGKVWDSEEDTFAKGHYTRQLL